MCITALNDQGYRNWGGGWGRLLNLVKCCSSKSCSYMPDVYVWGITEDVYQMRLEMSCCNMYRYLQKMTGDHIIEGHMLPNPKKAGK